jgi:hypothetical protein
LGDFITFSALAWQIRFADVPSKPLTLHLVENVDPFFFFTERLPLIKTRPMQKNEENKSCRKAFPLQTLF